MELIIAKVRCYAVFIIKLVKLQIMLKPNIIHIVIKKLIGVGLAYLAGKQLRYTLYSDIFFLKKLCNVMLMAEKT